ncbi:MAG: TetR/AcrR family transcriptional regulator [Arthrospira sp. SH-MAG29]|nr:TetR/AcrR family transcriptional regulator [Arthrospira sp. SH-MAG29]MBS0015411.1 TetR/AcrR family transcriptional regulator [Arthrospira sp. SH-MAG29]
MNIFNQSPPREVDIPTRILKAATKLFARRGYEATTIKDLAAKAQVAEGTIFRYFPNKKAILVEVVTQGWVEILTDLLTELSEVANYQAISQIMRHRMMGLDSNADLLRVCFLEAQFHPELSDRIQSEIIATMTDVAEAFFQTAIEKGVYRPMNPRMVAQVFLGMFAVAGFSYRTIIDPAASPKDMQEMAEGLTDIFLNGIINRESTGHENL